MDSLIDSLITSFSHVTFSRNLVETFRSDRSTYLQNNFLNSFDKFEVTTNFVPEESFLNKYLATLIG